MYNVLSKIPPHHLEVIVSRSIYGTIVVTALLISLEHYEQDAGRVIFIIIASMAAVSLAEIYANIMGMRIKKRGHLNMAESREAIGEGALTFAASQPHILIFILAALGVMPIQDAFQIAQYAGIFLLGFYGYAYASLAGYSKASRILTAGTDAAIGLLLILLKSLFH